MNVLVINEAPRGFGCTDRVVQNLRPTNEVWIARSAQEGIAVSRNVTIDLIFLQVNLADLGALEKIRSVNRLYEKTPVVAIPFLPGAEELDRASGMCVSASVHSHPITLEAAGRNTIPARPGGDLASPPCMFDADRVDAAAGLCADWNLTQRQKDVLALLASGLSNKLIARKLGIAESTVKIHVTAILRELKVATRAQALVAMAGHEGHGGYTGAGALQ